MGNDNQGTGAAGGIEGLPASVEDDSRQIGFLRQKGLIGHDETLIAFYNNALVSPVFADDRTDTCMFVTNKRVVQVKGGKLNCGCNLTEIQAVDVDHNSIFSDDYVVLTLRSGTILKMEVIRESVGNTLAAMISRLAKINR